MTTKTTPTTEHDAALEASVAQMDRAVDAIFVSANSLARVITLDAPDVPRLLVSAALRSIEKLVEHYARRLEHEATGIAPFEMREKVVLQRTMLAAANDFLEVTAEAQQTAQRIRDGIVKNAPASEKPN